MTKLFLIPILFMSIHVFTQSFTEKQKIRALEIGTCDLYGATVSIDGDFAIVGAQFEDSDSKNEYILESSGCAFIYGKR